MMDISQVKTKIARLMKVAHNSASTQGEVENALKAAQNLMFAYHVEASEFLSDSDESSPTMATVVVATCFRRVAYWEKVLAAFTIQLIGGIGSYSSANEPDARVVRNGRSTQKAAIVFYGVAEEANLAAVTYQELAAVIYGTAVSKYGAAYRGDGGVYALGFATGLMKQLDSLHDGKNSAAMQLATQSRAITQAKQKRAREWLRAELGIYLAASRPTYSSTGSRSAHEAGLVDGRNHDISGVTESGTSRAKPRQQLRLTNERVS